jgi:hypothetical protein
MGRHSQLIGWEDSLVPAPDLRIVSNPVIHLLLMTLRKSTAFSESTLSFTGITKHLSLSVVSSQERANSNFPPLPESGGSIAQSMQVVPQVLPISYTSSTLCTIPFCSGVHTLPFAVGSVSPCPVVYIGSVRGVGSVRVKRRRLYHHDADPVGG